MSQTQVNQPPQSSKNTLIRVLAADIRKATEQVRLAQAKVKRPRA
jgi:hypothetical protein